MAVACLGTRPGFMEAVHKQTNGSGQGAEADNDTPWAVTCVRVLRWTPLNGTTPLHFCNSSILQFKENLPGQENNAPSILGERNVNIHLAKILKLLSK